MKIIGVQSRVASFVMAVVLLPQISPALAGAPKGELAIQQGSRFPGMPEPSRETATNKRRGPVKVTFTKWGIPGSTTPFSLLAGFTGHDVPGDFVGEVLLRKVSQDYDPNLEDSTAGKIIQLEAIYEVQADNRKHSFTALVRGGQTGDTNAALGAGLLDGVILAGWRTGAQVHVAYQKISSCADRDGAMHGPCFEGTIHIDQAPEE